MNLGVAALIAIAGSVGANLAVYALAKAMLAISPDFPPLAGPGPVVMFSVLGVGAAVGVYALMRRRPGDVNRAFARIAIVALVVSLLPDLGLYASGDPSATPTAVGVLMVMHVVAAAIAVGVLTRVLPSN